ncbi:enoyl-ACP reductase [Blastocystis sp. subtype 4]|uniref:enoyl-ACP reductase n=1 Tax=Blastocystis sp. subtype 4 TaxID=944170 RepID=UPI000711F986|nr:enoyl-ACP reductase [Blastocystis sp. subtype 4]KNB45914.1 enoyl-ACP reductase [Blastocystis sp. subtype 4]|eukprot:XP_014529357.1 enoyl-ACP reductase [Blastocystis sp. subtype 4]
MSIAKASLEATAQQMAAALGPKQVRVNILRALPLNTLAARGIPDFLEMKKRLESTKMMQQVDGMKAVCDSAVYLASDLSEGVTGECINGKGLESE